VPLAPNIIMVYSDTKEGFFCFLKFEISQIPLQSYLHIILKIYAPTIPHNQFERRNGLSECVCGMSDVFKGVNRKCVGSMLFF
jgi:C4-dicarboxylate transporter